MAAYSEGKPPVQAAVPPVEDLSAVADRFQSWAAAQAAANQPATSRGLREISYEEALRASRYRRVEDPALEPVTDGFAGRNAPPLPDPVPDVVAIHSASRRSPAPPAAGRQRLDPDAILAALQSALASQTISTGSAPSVNGPGEIESFAAMLEAKVQARQQASAPAPETAPEPLPRQAAVPEAVPAARKTKAEPSGKPKSAKRAKSASAKPPRRSMEGQSALARTAPRGASDDGKAQSLTLRVQADERALMQMRADAAGLSLSAYLRQCAMEVEQLRGQMQMLAQHILVQQALSALPAALQPARSFTPEPPRGFLARIGSGIRRVFRGAGN